MNKHPVYNWLLPVLLMLTVISFWPGKVAAQSVPYSNLQAIVWVQCADRQGSGTIINDQGYILTNAHVAIDVATNEVPSTCVIGMIDTDLSKPKFFYRANVLHYVFNDKKNQDFAILQITRKITTAGQDAPFQFLKTDEFSTVDEALSVVAYEGETQSLTFEDGLIKGFQDGFILTDAKIFSGFSGGAGLNTEFSLIGMPTRIVTITTQSGVTESVDYELTDIRAVINWLDTFGLNEHDKYFTHADYDRYHQNAPAISQASLGCSFVARTESSSAVSCLLPGGERMIFPNSATFDSWFPNYSGVVDVLPEVMGSYQLTRNVTFKPGTLVKSYTAANVYVVVDSFGTMRWIPSESKAQTLWGMNWSSLVHDIPDEFFINYTIGQSLDP